MRRGCKRTPAEVLKARGSKLANERESVKPQTGSLRCPHWLDAEAKRMWAALLPELQRLGLMTVLDGNALAAYCQAYAEFKLATETLKREGRVFETGNGYKVAHPAVAQQTRAFQTMERFGNHFGLSPSSRASLNVPAYVDPQVDELTKFIGP